MGEPIDALAEVHVENRNPEVAGNGAGNAVENLGRLTREQLQLRRFEIAGVDVAEACAGAIPYAGIR